MPSSNLNYRDQKLIGHPARRRLLELLGEKGSMSFSELKAETYLPVGTLYYHLDVLRDLIVRDNERRYLLNKEGKKIYASLISNDGLPYIKPVQPLRLMPGWLFISLSNNLALALLAWIMIAIFGCFLSYESGQALILIFYSLSILPTWIDVILFPLSMICYLMYIFIMVWILEKRKVGLSGVFVSGIVFIPFYIIPLVSFSYFWVAESLLRIVYLCATIIIQVFTLVFGSTYVSSIYGMRLERSLLIHMIFYILSSFVFSVLKFLGYIIEL